MVKSEDIKKILDLLEGEYPDAECALDHQNVFQLIVAVALSAQTTDVSVNKVTPALFEAYPDAFALAKADPSEVEIYIKRIGMYRTKAKNIVGLAKNLVEKHEGKVPDSYDDLVALPGVGRKTANVVLSVGFGHQRIAVDTHAKRISNRLGLSSESDPSKIEQDLIRFFEKKHLKDINHLLVWHGRNTCSARNPKCDTCKLNVFCNYYSNSIDK